MDLVATVRQGERTGATFAQEEREIMKHNGNIVGKIIQCGLALAFFACILVAKARAEDPIAAWNEITERAVKSAGHPPPVASLDFAIVHLAIYDAVESIDRRYDPYQSLVHNATGSA